MPSKRHLLPQSTGSQLPNLRGRFANFDIDINPAKGDGLFFDSSTGSFASRPIITTHAFTLNFVGDTANASRIFIFNSRDNPTASENNVKMYFPYRAKLVTIYVDPDANTKDQASTFGIRADNATIKAETIPAASLDPITSNYTDTTFQPVGTFWNWSLDTSASGAGSIGLKAIAWFQVEMAP